MMGNELILALVCALTFFGAGELDSRGEAHDYRYPWALMSALLSALILIVFKGSWAVLLLSQVGLFVGIGVFRLMRDPT